MDISGEAAGVRMKKGFTLIEVLITASIMALVAVAILSVFAAGLKVYERVRKYSDIRTDILFSLEKMEKDLRSLPNIPQIDFKAQPGLITFPAVVHANPDNQNEISLGSISYYVDDSSHYLVKDEKDYSAATAEEPGEGIVTNLVYVNSLKFTYYFYDEKAKAFYWAESWKEDKEENKTKRKPVVHTPLGVKIEVSYDDNGESNTLTRTIYFPLAVSLYNAELASEKKR
jgi:prepilin-type N-terminal cleavage/methylation domain-containing protein